MEPCVLPLLELYCHLKIFLRFFFWTVFFVCSHSRSKKQKTDNLSSYGHLLLTKVKMFPITLIHLVTFFDKKQFFLFFFLEKKSFAKFFFVDLAPKSEVREPVVRRL